MNVPAARVAQHKWQPNTPDGKGIPFLFHHGKATATSTSSGSLMRMFKGPASSGTDDAISPGTGVCHIRNQKFVHSCYYKRWGNNYR
ncbi:unnamed protein product [Brassica oleracea var. botrytis]